MNFQIPTTSSVSVTWKPGQPVTDKVRQELIAQGEALAEKANKVKDYFQRSDNNDYSDSCPAEGYVCIPIDDKGSLLEERADRIKGKYSAEEDRFTAVAWEDGQSYLGASKLIVEGSTIFHDRPAYLNSTPESMIESLTANQDGTLTYTRAVPVHY
ncbi:MAG TPA: hypothetical protein EYO33_17715 [Phycisphaerales bacterium]|nr:hypothetical protein [Phycisphaerales bacterium]